MNRRGGAMTDSEADDDGAGVADLELIQMKRQLRIMEKDYHAYKEQTKNQIRKQTDELNVLEREKTEIDTDLKNSSDKKLMGKDERQISELQSLHHKELQLQAQIREEQDACHDLDKQISEMKEKIRQEKKQTGGSSQTGNKHQQMNKKKLVLEGRLDKKLKSFNKVLSTNKSLREEIDHIRREKNIFDNLYQQLSRKLDSLKCEMTDVIEEATLAFEQRDEAQNKMAVLTDKNEKDAAVHEAEMKDLRRKIHHDDKIKEFMMIKSDDRADLKAEEAAKKEAMRDGKAINAELALIQEYEEAFSTIKEVTGENDINVIVQKFIKDEEENFALFNYVNELNSEMEILNDQVAAIKADIQAFEKEDIDDRDKHQEVVVQMESQLTELAKESENYKQQLIVTNKSLDQLKSGIESMFGKMGCDPKPIHDMLGGEEGINNKNIMTYLGLIEQKTTQLLTAMYYTQLKKSEIEGGPPPTPPDSVTIPQTPRSLNIVPPGVGDGEDLDDCEEEEDSMPLSESELRKKVNKGIEKRQVAIVQQAATKGVTKEKRKMAASSRHSPSPVKKGTALKN